MMLRIYAIVIILIISLHGYSTSESESQKIAFPVSSSTIPQIIIDGDFRDWTKDDLLTMSEPNNEYILNDGFDNSRDMIAFYFRQTEKTLYFRIDFFDLKINAENGYLDFYILINFTSNLDPQLWLPDNTDTKTDSPWSIAIAIYDTLNYNIYTPDWNTTYTSAMEAIAFHGQYDSVELAVNSRILTDSGYANNETLKFQIATTKDYFENVGKSDLLDTIPQSVPWDNGYLNGTILSTNRGGTTKISFVHHGNQFIKNIDDFIEDKNRLGFINVPRIHEKWNVPVNLHLSGTMIEGIQWYKPYFNDYLRELVKKGIVDMLGGYYSEYIPKYAPPELNNWSLKYGLKLAKEFYGDNYVPCAWLPERVFWENYDESIKNNGYDCVIADTEDAFRWYAEPQFTNEHKVYTSPKGLKIFFISNRGNNTPPENRYNIQDAIFQLTDEGLNINLREKFIYYALNNDREQYWLYMDDWEKVTGNIPDWGGPEVLYFYERAIAWLANHPWTEVVTLDRILNFSTAGTVDIKDATYFWLSGSASRWKGDALAGFGSLGNYDAWYYDPRGEIKKGTSYFEYIPADTNMKLGDYKTADTLIYKTWTLIKNIKNETLKDLAFKTFANGFYETAWRDFLRMDQDISYWQKEQAAHIRYAAYYYYADQWLNSTFVTRNSSLVNLDVDFDSKDEYILSNEHLFTLFESRGGKLVFAIDNNGVQLVGNQPVGYLDERDSFTDAITDTTGNTHYYGAKYLEGNKVFAFEDLNYENEIYNLTINNGDLIAKSQNKKINKSFRLDRNQIIANYQNTETADVRIGVLPDLENLLRSSRDSIGEFSNTTTKSFGWFNKNTNNRALIYLGNSSFKLSKSVAYTNYIELKHETQNSEIRLEIGKKLPAPNSKPVIASIPQNVTVDDRKLSEKILDLRKYFNDDYDSPDNLTYKVESLNISDVLIYIYLKNIF